MNSINEETKKDFIETFYFEKEYISAEEYSMLAAEGKEDIGIDEDENEENTKYYKIIKKDFNSEELQEYYYMKSLDLNLRMLNNLRTLKEENIANRTLMRWLVVICGANLFFVIWILIKLFGHLSVWP